MAKLTWLVKTHFMLFVSPEDGIGVLRENHILDNAYLGLGFCQDVISTKQELKQQDEINADWRFVKSGEMFSFSEML